MNPALLIIDLQKAFIKDYVSQQKVDNVCEHINYVADLFRKNNHLVVHIKDMESIDEFSSEELDFIYEVKREPTELVLEKDYSNAFWKTGLESILKENNIDLVICCGFAAENCVLFTHNGAIERGFKSVILQNGILSRNEDMITATYRDRNLISYPVIESMFSK
jgi:nicotinamidase-related amidase